ncbi:hypothetical protein [Spiroplasma turonicum]|uniref:Uncharacterized protein n=1 Tax=Spiroplasma turonicum TaxID=216946 RepID=A0A0K1P7A2_9MOLU|nr:hypothetical protein [Spiroplasma turonicum]AKU80158.1 hypothetical protein STURON_00912 [Spiroplasma turonicum]ALX71158.1 hypothetical protein STURO_v1c09070 [Spiroplasma turonicum]
MAFTFDEDIDYIFTFCKICWDYKKFLFDNPISFETQSSSVGICVNCNKQQNINLYEVKDYYLNLNNNNN